MGIQRLFGKRPDSMTQDLSSSLTPLKLTFAPSESVDSPSSSPVISDPFILAPRDSVHRQSWPSKPTNPYVVTTPVKKLRHDLPSDFHSGQAQSFGPRASIMGTDDLPTKSKSYEPEFRRCEDAPRSAEPVPAFQVPPPTITKSRNPIRKPLPRPPISGAPDPGSSARPAPLPESLPSGSLAFKRPLNSPQPRGEFHISLGVADSHDTSDTARTSLSEIGMPYPTPVDLVRNTDCFSIHLSRLQHSSTWISDQTRARST